MKTPYSLLIITMLLLGSIVRSYAQSQRSSIIFVDKSSSVANDDGNKAIAKSVISILKQQVLLSGDKIFVSFIYKSTANSANLKGFIFNPPKLNVEGLSRLDKKRASIKYQKLLHRYKLSYAKNILAYINDHNIPTSETNLFGALKVIDNLLQANINPLSVYFLSDMIPCSKFKRYFCKNGVTLSDFASTNTYAIEDLKEAMKFYQLDKQAFSSVFAVEIFLPPSPLETNEAYVYMPQYWITIFRQLGIQKVSIH